MPPSSAEPNPPKALPVPTDQAPAAAADTVPGPASPDPDNFPIVGIGASAGGLSAFEAFFAGMPPATEPGMAFVLVQHLAPDHASLLADLVSRYTRMQVQEVTDGMAVQPNGAYIIPPNKDMALRDGKLQLQAPDAPRGLRLPIDFFFRSLAEDQEERALGVILSGTGSDGSLGVRAIKGAGGLVMVQDPATTDFDAMPRNAIATGLVDSVLAPQAMPEQLIAYTRQALQQPSRPLALTADDPQLSQLFTLLRQQTGHDFSGYKPSTIQRRLQRRMAVRQIACRAEYVHYAQRNPGELQTLFRDMLIGVTSFFRDPEVFAALETEVIPQLFAGKPATTPIRVWVPGCATGEEAYSLAILLAEQQRRRQAAHPIMIFATDIDSEAIATARAGRYPASIAADLSPERLDRFCHEERDGPDDKPVAYTLDKTLRDYLIFSEQDLIADPPFSRLDLISCRNLLIYLSGELQKTIIPLFHYALNPDGFLCLGTSESIGDHHDLFTTLDRRAKLFQRRHDAERRHPSIVGQFFPRPPAAAGLPPKPEPAAVAPGQARSLREVTEQSLLQQVCAPRRNTCRAPPRNSRPPTKNSNPPTRKCSPSTNSCNRPTRNSKPPRKNCNR